MLTNNEKAFLKEYVDNKYYDFEKLIKYLSMHDIVGNEIFSYCDRRAEDAERSTYGNCLDDEYGYVPLKVSDFVRRCPFYFYVNNLESGLEYFGDLGRIISAENGSRARKESDPDALEKIYQALEYMFYHLRLPLLKIFTYWINQTGLVSGDTFMQWNHYLHLCEENGSTEYFPERFISAYNEMLEQNKLEPIMYEIDEKYNEGFFMKKGTTVTFEGQFPCDKAGNPIMKWIGISASDIVAASCNCEKSRRGRLTLEITPKTIIELLNIYNDNDDTDGFWYQVYAGPMNMEFDYTILKERRKRLHFTQQEVADAVGSTVRTYQKWENGETIPDGHYLIRLMNWLDIRDVQNTVKYIPYKENA